MVDSLDLEEIVKSGDSLLVASPGLDMVIEIVDSGGVRLDFIQNSSGRLGHVLMEVVAANFADAATAAHDLIMPALSRLAFQANTPLDVKASVILEKATQSIRLASVLVGQYQPLPLVPGTSTQEQRMLLASYREGLNSTAPLYQILCFHKVIEGARGFQKRRLRAAIRSNSDAPPDPMRKRFPDRLSDLPASPEWENTLLEPYLGMTFAEIDTAIGQTMRDAVAHITPGKGHLVADYLQDLENCRGLVPVLRLMAHKIIEMELTFSETAVGDD